MGVWMFTLLNTFYLPLIHQLNHLHKSIQKKYNMKAYIKIAIIFKI